MSFRRKITRRQFIKGAAIAGGAMMMPGLGPFVRKGHAFGFSMPLEKFIQPMPLFGGEIPLAAKITPDPYKGVDYYRLTAGVFQQQLHPDLPNPTRLYGYADHTGNHVHLGGAVLATKGRPVRFSFHSALPSTHILPFDISIPSPGNGGDRQDRAAVHLHGGLVPWTSDGGPFHWQCPDPTVVGASVEPWLWDGSLDGGGNPDPTKKVWDYFYPNNQSARLMWYHDHAIGQTRLNAYAGVATGYIVQDTLDNIGGGWLQTLYGIPFLGQPIVFQDKVFWDPQNDPLYDKSGGGNVLDPEPGDLWYPWKYDPAIWPVAPGATPPTPSAVAEFFGDTMLANGVVYPSHSVTQGTHRFRLLNACNARWLDLSFVQEDGATGEPLFKGKGQPVLANVDVTQIGTEGGFLPKPVPLVTAGVPNQPFLLGPAERADILVTFNTPGNIILYNVAGAPFPGGAPIFDWYVGNRNLPVMPAAGYGPNTRTIMRFAVSTTKGTRIKAPKDIPVSSIPTELDPVNGGLRVNQKRFAAQFPGFAYDPNQNPESLTLNEVVEPPGFTSAGNTGRLLTLIGNQAFPTLQPFGAGGTYYLEPPTETVRYNTLRIWHVYNFTADAHPMHFHLFNVQILGRRKVNGAGVPTGMAVPPLPNELGFKETVIMYPGEVTIVAALVEDPMPAGPYPRDDNGRPQVAVTVGNQTVMSAVPPSPRLASFGLTNHDEYVWHCHILEHEEHDMMRPLVAF